MPVLHSAPLISYLMISCRNRSILMPALIFPAEGVLKVAGSRAAEEGNLRIGGKIMIARRFHDILLLL